MDFSNFLLTDTEFYHNAYLLPEKLLHIEESSIYAPYIRHCRKLFLKEKVARLQMESGLQMHGLSTIYFVTQ